MTLQEFNEQMARLNEDYRDYYSISKMKTLWAIVGDIDASFLERKINKALWADHPPKLDWFQQIKSEWLHKKSEMTSAQSVFQDPRNESKYSHQQIEEFCNQIRSSLGKVKSTDD